MFPPPPLTSTNTLSLLLALSGSNVVVETSAVLRRPLTFPFTLTCISKLTLLPGANTTPLTMAAVAYLIIFMPLVGLSRWVESRFAWKR